MPEKRQCLRCLGTGIVVSSIDGAIGSHTCDPCRGTGEIVMLTEEDVKESYIMAGKADVIVALKKAEEKGGTHYGPECSRQEYCLLGGPTGVTCPKDSCDLEDKVREMPIDFKKVLRLTGDQDIDGMLSQCLEILGVKGDDYTIGTGDRLHNFKTVSAFTGMTPEQVLGVYLYKHISAVYAYIKSGGQNESEPIDGRIADCINYLLLFIKMIKERSRIDHGVHS